MMPNVGEIFMLSNNKTYVVASLTNYLDNIYCYLANMNNADDTLIALYKENKFEIVNDEELRYELEKLFVSNIE